MLIQIQSIPLDLTSVLNNKGIGTYPAGILRRLETVLPRSKVSKYKLHLTRHRDRVLSSGVYRSKKPDNVISSGQTLSITSGSYFSASFLASSDVQGGAISANVSFLYSDGSSVQFELRALNWYSTLTIDRGLIIFPYRYTARGVNWNTSHIFERTAALDPGKTLTAIKLPRVSGLSAPAHLCYLIVARFLRLMSISETDAEVDWRRISRSSRSW